MEMHKLIGDNNHEVNFRSYSQAEMTLLDLEYCDADRWQAALD